jgi:hypothetical protein
MRSHATKEPSASLREGLALAIVSPGVLPAFLA